MNAGGDEHAISIRPGFAAVKAVQEGRILLINEKLISSPSLRYPTGVMELARSFYPDQLDGLSPYSGADEATRRDFANIVFRARHLPIFIPSSSKYYETEQTGHVYGLFEDVTWRDPDFDAIETCVQAGFIGYDGDRFNPDDLVTRDELAKTVFLIGAFKARDNHIAIADIGDSGNQRIVQTLVDNGVFELAAGAFNPGRAVTRDEIINALEHINN
jgi:iron complex transport system substrate-binding protein